MGWRIRTDSTRQLHPEPVHDSKVGREGRKERGHVQQDGGRALRREVHHQDRAADVPRLRPAVSMSLCVRMCLCVRGWFVCVGGLCAWLFVPERVCACSRVRVHVCVDVRVRVKIDGALLAPRRKAVKDSRQEQSSSNPYTEGSTSESEEALTGQT